jgi:hypothetical protein
MMQSSDSEADLILARFPGPVTLYPSRKKWLLLLLGGCLFTFGGFWMVSDAEPWGWFVLLFFAAGTIVSVVMLLPGASGVTLDVDGFLVTSLYRRHRSRWRDVTGFVPVSIPYSRQKLVAFDDATITGGIAKMSVDISGHNAALPDTYGLSVDDLAQLMTHWRDRARA